MIKSKSIQKFYIKQFVLNNENSFQDWWTNNITDILVNDTIIGYIFSEKDKVVFGEPSKVLNLYLIKKKYYHGPEITNNLLEAAWKLFFETHDIIFVNPPIEQWIDTKENWCKKLAGRLSAKYDMSFSEALSEVYLAVMNCYRKGSVYMGNLAYIQRAANNNLLMRVRANKIRINQDSGLAVSLDTIVNPDSMDDEELSLIDIIPEEEVQTEESLEYKELFDRAMKLLRKSFTDREIDQILNQKAGFMPANLYRRLAKWRFLHSSKELYNEKTK